MQLFASFLHALLASVGMLVLFTRNIYYDDIRNWVLAAIVFVLLSFGVYKVARPREWSFLQTFCYPVLFMWLPIVLLMASVLLYVFALPDFPLKRLFFMLSFLPVTFYMLFLSRIVAQRYDRV